MDPQITAALIGGGFTAGAAIVGFGAVAWQVARQGRLSRDERRDAEQRRFKAGLYEDGIRAAREMSDKASEFMGYLRNAQMQIQLASGLSSVGQRFAVPSVRFLDVMTKYGAFTEALHKFIALIEERQILDPKILIFRDVLIARTHDLSQRYPREFQAALMPSLPMDNPDGGLFPYTPPSDARLGVLTREIELACDVLTDCICYKEDFIVEMQNALLGDVFESRVNHRVPLDPNKRVARLDDFDALSAWIATTDWGKLCAKIDQETLDRFPRLANPRSGAEGGDNISKA